MSRNLFLAPLALHARRLALAWVSGAAAVLVCVLALMAGPAAEADPQPWAQPEAVAATEDAAAPVCAEVVNLDKETADREWTPLSLARFALDPDAAGFGAIQASRLQFQTSPPQRPPRALA